MAQQFSKRRRTLPPWLPALVLGLLFWGCTKDSENSPEGVQVRIENLSGFTLNQVEVDTDGGAHTFTNIGPGELTDYQPFDFTYRYAFIQAIVLGDTLTLQPIDYVGEQRFTSGKFSFLVDFVGDPPLYMVVNFRED